MAAQYPEYSLAGEIDAQSESMVMVSDRSRLARVSLETGAALGPVVSSGMGTLPSFGYSAAADLAFVGSFERGEIAAFDMTTGTRRWSARGFSKVSLLSPYSQTNLIAQGVGGGCARLDQQTGEVLDRSSGVLGLAAEPDGDRIVLLRRSRIELRRDLADTPALAVRAPAETLNSGAFAPDCCIVSTGSLVRCIEWESRRIRWTLDPGPGRTFNDLAIFEDSGVVFCNVTSESSPVTILLDVRTGRVMQEQPHPAPGAFLSRAGDAMVGPHGMLHIPSLRWQPLPFDAVWRNG